MMSMLINNPTSIGVTIEPALGPLSAAYVLFLAVAAPLLARLAK